MVREGAAGAWVMAGWLLMLPLVHAPSASAQEAAGEEDGWAEDASDEVGWGQPAPAAEQADEADADGWAEDADDAAGWGEAEDEAGWDADDAAGFGGANSFGGTVSPAPIPEPLSEASAWSGTAFLRTDGALWVQRFDSNPFAKLRQSADIALRYKKKGFRLRLAGHLERDFAYLVERDTYDQPTIDVYEQQLLVRESFLAYGKGPLELSFGYHIVAWGQGDVVSPVDVVNPRDMREPGLADLDDLRMPILSTRISLFFGDHRVEGMVIHEAYFGLRSPPFGPFSPVGAVFAGSGLVVGGVDFTPLLQEADIGYREGTERWHIQNQQVLGRWVYKGPGIDVGLYAASVLDQQGVIGGVVPRVTAEVEVPFPVDAGGVTPNTVLAADMILDHPRYTMIGHSGAVPSGDWVFKWEGAAQIDRMVNVGDPNDPTDLREDRARLLGGMLGASWGGLPDTTLFLEVAKNWLVNDLEAPLLFPVTMPTVALRSQTTFLKERLELSIAGTMWGWRAQYGGLVRAELSYNVLDGLNVGVGFITYQPTQRIGPIYGFEDHDRVFAKLRYDFVLL